MVVSQGDICWADLGVPLGSSPGYRRPVIVVQADPFNRSRLKTTICVPLTGNLALAEAPGNVLLRSRITGLPRDSVANPSQILAVDKEDLLERVGHLEPRYLNLVLSGIDTVLGR